MGVGLHVYHPLLPVTDCKKLQQQVHSLGSILVLLKVLLGGVLFKYILLIMLLEFSKLFSTLYPLLSPVSPSLPLASPAP